MKNPTEIFSDRVRNYLAYRPGYPVFLLDVLRAECNFNHKSVIADIGSGTGLLSELFLKNGNQVFGVEPNTEMRQSGENRLKVFPRFVSVAGSAEATTLERQSVDFVTAGQAIHWFDPARTKPEFRRILKPKGWVVVIYNVLRTDTPFLMACQKFYDTYLVSPNVEAEESDLYTPYFGAGNFTQQQIVGVSQQFDLAGLIGRVLSRANAPKENSLQYVAMIKALEAIFEQYAQAGKVELLYATEVVYGKLSEQ
jgi:SAM-dependent methyltransferase